jgi:hypothetical protein
MLFPAEQLRHLYDFFFYPHIVPPERGRLHLKAFNEIVAWLCGK